MGRTIAIGAQDFADIRERGCFLVDKTDFIRQWWRAGDPATLICRPRRFGKTLNMSMLECFFSDRYAGRADLFEGLSIWDDEAMRAEQGVWPVVALSFAGIKPPDFQAASEQINLRIARAYRDLAASIGTEGLTEDEKAVFAGTSPMLPSYALSTSLQRLCELLYRRTGRRAIVLLDAYDAPMQGAWLHGYADEMAALMCGVFANTFKGNRCLERGVLAGVTYFSCGRNSPDYCNPAAITTTTPLYETCFGFTEAEVFAAMDEMGLADRAGVKEWYGGFTFGHATDIYNPWSITKYLYSGIVRPYWADATDSSAVDRLLRGGGIDVMEDFETLLYGGSVRQYAINEMVDFGMLGRSSEDFWNYLLANGYLKVVERHLANRGPGLDLALANREVVELFDTMICRWFRAA